MITTLTLTHSRGGESISKAVPVTTEGEQNIDVTVPGSTSDMQVQLALTVARLALVYITSTQTITLETNSSSAPAETITVTAEKPLVWYTGCGWANPFGTNVTAVFLTRATAGEAVVNLRFAYDATP